MELANTGEVYSMHLKSIHLKDFRGFSDLRIEDLPASAKLVMVIGPNGTGKSSLFDAFLTWSSAHGAAGFHWDKTFHVKKSAAEDISWSTAIPSALFHEGEPASASAWKKIVYVRSAYRNEPDFSQGNLGALPDLSERRFHRTIENDAAISANYRRLIMQTIKDVWGAGSNSKMTFADYTAGIIGKVNVSLQKVLPGLRMTSLGDPSTSDGNFYFSKGISRDYLFKNLSGGEKAIFDLLIDFITKTPYFDNSLICIDEPESHVNPAIQGALLQELLSLTPESCQLWIATHAIGMLRRARDIASACPSAVAFINFDANFDAPITLRPIEIDRTVWQRSLAIALDDMASLVAPKRVILCEGGADARFTDDGFDAKIYNRVFGHIEPDTQFFSSGSHAGTEQSRSMLIAISSTIVPGLEVRRLIDRDDRSDAEVGEERRGGVLVLSRRNLESYLFSDEIILKLCNSAGMPEKAMEIIQTRDSTLISKGAPSDDFKRAAGETYVACKKILGLSKAGNDAKAFMLQTLAPLLSEETATFVELKRDVFGR